MGTNPQPVCMANDERDAQTGTFETKYTDADFLDALDALGENGTKEVAEHVGCTREISNTYLWMIQEDSDQ